MQHQPPNDRIYYIHFLLSHLPPPTVIHCSSFRMGPQVQVPGSIPGLLHCFRASPIFSSPLVSIHKGFTHSTADPFQEIWKENLIPAPGSLIGFTITSLFPKSSSDLKFHSHASPLAKEPFIFNKAPKTHSITYSTQNQRKEVWG